ncbi:DUF6518 family protein [Actinobaculum suis]|uniref:DUF6518 family protein n=1 Tax=Actinobaculum suis TaxID=1657 RepID=A0AAW9HKW6_9ACTO|nr:DUF6518 family protein [Actinobaculum suis]
MREANVTETRSAEVEIPEEPGEKLLAKARQYPPSGFTAALGAGLAMLIGIGSVAHDALAFPGPLLRVLTQLASSGLGYVMIAVLVGWFSRSWRVAAGVASGAILGALLIYYGATVVCNLRPSGGGTELARIAIVWIILGLACGVIVGPTAFFAHYGNLPQRSIATGLPLGLILGPAAASIFSGVDLRSPEILAVVLVTVAIPCVGLLISLRRTRPALLLASTLTGTILAGGLFLIVYTLYY